VEVAVVQVHTVTIMEEVVALVVDRRIMVAEVLELLDKAMAVVITLPLVEVVVVVLRVQAQEQDTVIMGPSDLEEMDCRYL
jgi:hypothetical protein